MGALAIILTRTMVKTTLGLDDELLRRAAEVLGTDEPVETAERALREVLVQDTLAAGRSSSSREWTVSTSISRM